LAFFLIEDQKIDFIGLCFSNVKSCGQLQAIDFQKKDPLTSKKKIRVICQDSSVDETII